MWIVSCDLLGLHHPRVLGGFGAARESQLGELIEGNNNTRIALQPQLDLPLV